VLQHHWIQESLKLREAHYQTTTWNVLQLFKGFPQIKHGLYHVNDSPFVRQALSALPAPREAARRAATAEGEGNYKI
jgi:hypothetical protein